MSAIIRVAIAIMLATQAARAGELVSAGPLAITASDTVVLGRDASVELRLRTRKAPGTVTLVSSAGTISAPIEDGGQLRATLSLPSERYPQLAIVAAVDEAGAVVDWLAIPLAGQARIKVETARRARVMVYVAGREFGPVVADARGIAEVPIIVPPGVTSARTVATAGAVTEKTMSLGARTFSRVLSVCSQQRVVFVATTAAGLPSPDPPNVTASTGTLTTPIQSSPGVFEVAYTLADPSAELATITAAFAGEGSVATACTIQIPAEPPNAVRITTDRSQFVAGSGGLSVRVELAYAGTRRPLAVDHIAIDPDVGTIAMTRSASGWDATWTLPDALAGRATARARVRVALPGRRELTADYVVSLVPGAAASIEAKLPGPLRADGDATGTIVARMLDRWGNPIDAALRARARGTVGTFVAHADGARASYVAPRAREAGDDPVEIYDPASGLSTRATVQLAPLPRRFSITPRAGYLSNLGRVAAPLVMLSAGMRLPVLRESVVADVAFGLYSTALDAMTPTGEPVSGRLTTLPALARLAVHRPIQRFDLWAGAGAGIAIAWTRLSSPSAGTVRDQGGHLALTGFVGGATRVGPGSIVAEAAYLHATIADGPIAGRIGGVIGSAGFSLEF